MKLVQIGDKWFKVKIFGQQVNWATFVLSGCVFLGLEVWRRQKIKKQIEDEVALGIAKAKEEEGTIIDQVITGVDSLDWNDVLNDMT